MEASERFKQAEFAAMIGVVGNIALAIIKGILGVMGNSRALIADAAHSASDVLGSIAVFVGLRAAKRPPDEAEHLLAPIFRPVCWCSSLYINFKNGMGSFIGKNSNRN